jgi:KaiC/GvpD/RAD55 family RecA-like ATPase
MNKIFTSSLVNRDVHLLINIPKDLLTKVEIKWIDWITNYYRSYNVAPTIERFESEFSDFLPAKSPDPLADVYLQDIAFRRNSIVRDTLIKNSKSISDGVDPYNDLQELVKKLRIPTAEVVNAGDYDVLSFADRQITFNTGFSSIDDNGGGITQGDLCYLFGRPGSVKTTLLIDFIVRWSLLGHKVTVISNEINYQDITYKIYAQMAGIDVTKKRSGQLEENDIKRLNAVRLMLNNNRNLNIVKRPVHRVTEVEGLLSDDTDLLCIDGVYFMSYSGSSSSDWKELTEVSRMLKQIATRRKIGVVGVIQANRSAENGTGLSSAAGTDAFTQDSDLLLGINPSGFFKGGRQILITSNKNRNGSPFSCVVNVSFPIVSLWENEQ